jgi:hypothetical protein
LENGIKFQEKYFLVHKENILRLQSNADSIGSIILTNQKIKENGKFNKI